MILVQIPLMEHKCGSDEGVCRYCSGDTDNQLGYICNILELELCSKSTPIKFKPLNTDFSNVHYAHNVIANELAMSVRDFLDKIPLTHENDEPQKIVTDLIQDENYVYTYLSTMGKLKSINKCPEPNPKLWKWDNYKKGMQRASPTTLSDFIDSPIHKLITKLESKFNSTNYFPGIDFSQYKKATWVLQKVGVGDMIGPHTDENSQRKFAFVYYLTPDNWNYKTEGGELVVSDQKSNKIDKISNCIENNKYIPGKSIQINPEFNSIIAWKLGNGKSPLHWVNTVKSFRPRYSLVGFFVAK